MAKLPWFKFYPRDFLMDEKVQLMSNLQVGIYIKLLCHQWEEGSIPEAKLGRLAFLRHNLPQDTHPWLPDCDTSEDVRHILDTCFVQHPILQGRLINEKLERIRIEIMREIEGKRKGGRKASIIKAKLKLSTSLPRAEHMLSQPYSESESDIKKPLLSPLSENLLHTPSPKRRCTICDYYRASWSGPDGLPRCRDHQSIIRSTPTTPAPTQTP